MAGTVAGAIKARNTNRKRYGDDYYKRIGSLGGKVSVPDKGFAHNKELARIAGAKGGKLSRRTWTAEERKRHSDIMSKLHTQKKAGHND